MIDTLTTTMESTANVGSFAVQFAVMLPSDLYYQASDSAADKAMDYGLAGYEITAQVAAELADAYAELGASCRRIEQLNGRVEDRRKIT